ncbi:hypothetical protein TKK_0019090 [Trichogramma kaykai]
MLTRQLTEFSDDIKEPPKDVLMKTLVEFANAENPQCANCDKRDKNEMFFCATCVRLNIEPLNCSESLVFATVLRFHQNSIQCHGIVN